MKFLAVSDSEHIPAIHNIVTKPVIKKGNPEMSAIE
jgi:hypothetical protein